MPDVALAVGGLVLHRAGLRAPAPLKDLDKTCRMVSLRLSGLRVLVSSDVPVRLGGAVAVFAKTLRIIVVWYRSLTAQLSRRASAEPATHSSA